MEAAIITAALSFLGTLLIGFWNFKRDRDKNKTDLAIQLLQTAMNLNKQELDTLRTINNDLKAQLLDEIAQRKNVSKELEDERRRIVLLEQEISELDLENKTLRADFEDCKRVVKQQEGGK